MNTKFRIPKIQIFVFFFILALFSPNFTTAIPRKQATIENAEKALTHLTSINPSNLDNGVYLKTISKDPFTKDIRADIQLFPLAPEKPMPEQSFPDYLKPARKTKTNRILAHAQNQPLTDTEIITNEDISQFNKESLELIHANCDLPVDTDTKFQSLQSMARFAQPFSSVFKKPVQANVNPRVKQLLDSMHHCSGSDLLESMEAIVTLKEAKKSKLLNSAPTYLPKLPFNVRSTEVPRDFNNEDIQSSTSTIDYPDTEFEQKRTPHHKTSAVPTDLVGSFMKISEEEEELPQLPSLPEYPSTPLPPPLKNANNAPEKPKSSFLEKLKNNPVTKWFSKAFSSIKYFFVDALKPKPALKHQNHVYYKPPADDELIRERRSFGGMAKDLTKFITMPIKKLFSKKNTSGKKEGERTVKKFLNAAIRVYVNSCADATDKNVEMFKKLATMALEQLTSNDQIMFGISEFADKKLVKAVNACKR